MFVLSDTLRYPKTLQLNTTNFDHKAVKEEDKLKLGLSSATPLLVILYCLCTGKPPQGFYC